LIKERMGKLHCRGSHRGLHVVWLIRQARAWIVADMNDRGKRLE
jgi:hypothetical protein